MEVLQLRQQLYQSQILNMQLQGQILMMNIQSLNQAKKPLDDEIQRRQAEEKKQKEKSDEKSKK